MSTVTRSLLVDGILGRRTSVNGGYGTIHALHVVAGPCPTAVQGHDSTDVPSTAKYPTLMGVSHIISSKLLGCRKCHTNKCPEQVS